MRARKATRSSVFSTSPPRVRNTGCTCWGAWRSIGRAGTYRRRAPPRAARLLGKAWSVAQAHFEAAVREPAVPGEAPGIASPVTVEDLRWIRPEALAVSVAEPAFVPRAQAREALARIEFSWVGETARQVGTVAHRWLQRIAEDGLEQWNAARVRGLRQRVEAELERRGVPAADRDAAAGRVLLALETTLADAKGRWILGSRPGAANEVRMHVLEEGRVRLVVMDRVFVAERTARAGSSTTRRAGTRVRTWKPSSTASAAATWSSCAAMPGRWAGKPRLGLYFPLIPGWREIDG